MGIFRDITKKLKKAAPLIGSAIGMYFGGPLGASIGSGIGSLASGRSAEEALRNAALTGATTYAMGGKDFGKGFKFDTSGSPFASVGSGVSAEAPVSAVKETGIGPIFDKIIPESTMGKIALGGTALGLLGLGDEEVIQNKPIRDYPVGKTRLGYGRIGDKLYNLDDEEERKQYFEDNRKRQGAEDIEDGDVRIPPFEVVGFRANEGGIAEMDRNFMVGGEVRGPGSGTSDSVPARLSDGEFVVTAKAVRGAGGGDRNVGAARMYDMMSQLEGAA